MATVTREELMAAKVASVAAYRALQETLEWQAYQAAKLAMEKCPAKVAADEAAATLEEAEAEFGDFDWCEACWAPLRFEESVSGEDGESVCRQFVDESQPCFAEAAKAAGLA